MIYLRTLQYEEDKGRDMCAVYSRGCIYYNVTQINYRAHVVRSDRFPCILYDPSEC